MRSNLLEDESTQTFRVIAEIRQLNKYVQRVKKIAISAINPVLLEQDGSAVRALNIRVEGPPKHIGYFNRLIDEANLKLG